MNLAQSLALGLIQGITEFLPVSSSGHLVICRELLGLGEIGNAFDIFLHLGTVFSVLIFFRKRIWELVKGFFRLEKKSLDYLLYIILASIPTVIIGFSIEEFFNGNFPIFLVGSAFFITSILLYIASKTKNENKEMTIKSSLFIGILQGIAVFPGISRSGATISGGILSKISRERAFEFSFLLSIPAIIGANLLKINDVFSADIPFLIFILGASAAFVSGLISLIILEKIVIKSKLLYFSPYLVLVGILSILIGFGII